MAASQSSKLSALEELLKHYPQITYATPSSHTYPSLREIFLLDQVAVPLAIVRPQTAADVSLLLKFAVSQGIKFVIRTGGHSLSGASQHDGALTIDMRDISYVEISPDKSSAKIGGGILQLELATKLAEEGLVTPTGTIGSVGYVGWATYGGYGPMSSRWGLGVDQILGAKVVNSEGTVVDADAKMLKGIRGGGGLFGVIVELEIKVYPLKNIFTGTIIFGSQDLNLTFKKFNAGYQELSTKGLPAELGVQQMIVNSPQGRMMCVVFTWSSEDLETGRWWLAKIEALGTAIMNTVSATTVADSMKATAAMVPPSVYGSSRTHNLRVISSEVTSIITDNLAAMPTDAGSMFTVHELRGPSATSNNESVFGTREQHFMLEMLGYSTNEENKGKSLAWAEATWQGLKAVDASNLLPGTYISLEPSAEVTGLSTLSKLYGGNGQEVLALKREFDSGNVFDLAMPRLQHLL